MSLSYTGQTYCPSASIPACFTHSQNVPYVHGAYLTSTLLLHIHMPINGFSSPGGVSIPQRTVMEPPGGLWLAWITEHPSEMVASFLLSSLSGGSRCRDSFSSCFCISSSWGKTVYYVMWDLKEIKEMESICFQTLYWPLLLYKDLHVTLLTHNTRWSRK